MANPQVEEGYVRIATELFQEWVKIRIPGEAEQIFKHIIRKTYGFNKKSDAISLSQFVVATGLSKVHICRGIAILLKMNLITQKGNEIAQEYSINKDFSTWKPLPKKVTLPKKVMTFTQKGNTSLPKKGTTIDNDTIDNITIDKAPLIPQNDLFENLWKIYPNKDGKKQAIKHFNTSVKTQKDAEDIQHALENYLVSDTVQKGFIKNGSTWFNNWRDWIDYAGIIKPNKAELLQQQNINACKEFIETFDKKREEPL